ncbi:long-chain acyl-CoA synthetase [Actinomadura coerulea]|uniref:Long-chain acyl-CoA synthetase n=1 Tax=Actinomadura coerulea TaxID=46159 RepID=A0A7X0FZF6_9ACTN|nr:AMP-binding protein [Actinomadura coerulea]MBB6395696.1 long-chain acyl-CoA synthetase [Actinomadura coerulea]GGQ26478.1 long-chain acyl-CoA synthetase [Actinomadura coerulea]
MVRSFFEYADKDPARVAVIHTDGRQITYGEMRDDANRISNFLWNRGLASGDVVASLLPNSYQLMALVRGATQLPLYLTPVNWHLTAPEIAYILRDSGAKVLFAADPFVELAEDAAAGAGLPGGAVVVLAVAPDGGAARLTGPVAAASAAIPRDRGAGNRMLYTSGTTGRPKGVRRPLRGISPEEAAGAALARARRYGADHEDGVFLGLAPMYHASPLAYADQALDVGHRVVLLERWNRERALEAIAEHGVTWLYLVPLMMRELLAPPEDERAALRVGSIRSIVHTAAPCPPHVKQAMIDWLGPVLVELYGGTEGSATMIRSEEWLTRVGSVGRALPHVSLRILDDDRNEVPVGQVGTVYFKNEELSFVYLGDPEKTAASRQDGHVTLGDLGRLDEDGYLYLSDRSADLIISGGVNIYPAEIEHALLELPGVTDACVVGRPDEKWGESVHAVVVVDRPGTDEEVAAALDAELRARIAGYKIPRSWAFAEELPRSAAGKLLRREVRESVAAPAR